MGATQILRSGLNRLGLRTSSSPIFDTVHVDVSATANAERFADAAVKHGFNLRVVDDDTITMSLDETVTSEHVDAIFRSFSGIAYRMIRSSCWRDLYLCMAPQRFKVAVSTSPPTSWLLTLARWKKSWREARCCGAVNSSLKRSSTRIIRRPRCCATSTSCRTRIYRSARP